MLSPSICRACAAFALHILHVHITHPSVRVFCPLSVYIYINLFPSSRYRGGKFFRSGGKFLRPEQMEHDSDEDSSEDSSDNEVGVGRKQGGPKPSAKLSSDDDEEEEKEEKASSKKRSRDSSDGGAPRKKSTAAKAARNAFFDEEAEASDDDDEDEEADGEGFDRADEDDPHDRVKKHYTQEDIRREQMDEEAEELIKLQDRRRKQAGGARDLRDADVAQIAQDIEARHRMQRRTVDRSVLDMGGGGGGGVGGAEDYGAVAQQSLVPSVSDPSLFMLSCSTGKEGELVYQIMNKAAAFARQGRPLGITGAIAAQSKGKIYIEAYEEPAVIEALEGIRGIMQYSRTKLPISDMTTVLTVTPTKKPGKSDVFLGFLLISFSLSSSLRGVAIRHHCKISASTHISRLPSDCFSPYFL